MGVFSVVDDFTPVPEDEPEFSPARSIVQPNEENAVDFDLGLSVSNSIELDGTIGAVKRMMGNSDFEFDPEFRLEDNVDSLMDGVPEGVQPVVLDAVSSAGSVAHAQTIKNRTMEEIRLQKELTEQGWGGLAVRVGVNLFDPGALALTLAAGPLGAGVRATRISRAVRTGMIAGAENAALEVALYSSSETRRPEDILYAGLFGAALGGGFGAVLGGKGGGQAAADNTPNGYRNFKLAETAERQMDRLDKINLENGAHKAPSQPMDDALLVATDLDEINMNYLRGLEAERTAAGHVSVSDLPPTASAGRAVPGREGSGLVGEDVGIKQFGKMTDDNIEFSIDDLAVDGDNALSPYMLPDGRWVSTGGDHLSFANEHGGFQDYGSFSRATGAVRSSTFVDPTDGRVKVFMQVYEGQVITKAQVDSVKAILSKGNGDLAIGRSAADGSEDFANPSYKPSTLDDLDALVNTQADTKSAGAAAVGGQAEDLQTYTFDPIETEDFLASYPRQAHTGWQWGMSAQMADSPNQRARVMGDMMSENAVGNVDHAVSHSSASEIATMYHEVAEATFARAWRNELPAWRAEQGLNYVQGEMPSNRYKFMVAIGKAVRTGKGSPAELEAAKGLAEAFGYVAGQAKRGGVKGYGVDFNIDPSYLPRILDNETISKWANDLSYKKAPGGMDTPAEELIRRGLKSAQPDMDDALARRVATHYIRAARKRSVGEGGQLLDLNTTDMDVLEDMLRDMQMDEDDIGDVLRQMETSGGSTDRPSRAKSRLLMDIDVELPNVLNKETGEYSSLKLADMFSQDAESLLTSYAHSVGGLAAIAQRTKGTPFHIRSKGDWDDFITSVKTEEEGLQPRTFGVLGTIKKTALFQSKKLEGDLEILDLMWRRVNGIPITDPTSALNVGVRRMSAYNFASDMGNVWTAQLSEWGSVFSAVGMKTMLQHMPGLKNMLSNPMDLNTVEHLASTMEAWLGTGTHRVRSQASLRGFDNDLGAISSSASGVDNALHKAGEITGFMMHKVMEQQGHVVSTGMMQDFANVAVGGKGRLTAKRLAGLGIDKSMMGRISKQMNSHARSTDGRLVEGSKLHDPHFHSWEDLDARDALLFAVRRKARKAVQENDIGQMHQAQLHSPIVRLLTQFRSFVFAAMPKQLLHNVHMRDMEATQYAMSTFLMAMVGNYARLQIINAGKPDRDKRLKEALDPEAFLKTSLARTAWMSVIPALVDTGSQFVSGDPFFGQYRSTGLDATPITGNPSFRRLGAAYNLGSGLLRAAVDDDYKLSMEDWRNARSIMMFNTLAPVSNGLNALGDALDLPKTSEKGFRF